MRSEVLLEEAEHFDGFRMLLERADEEGIGSTTLFLELLALLGNRVLSVVDPLNVVVSVLDLLINEFSVQKTKIKK